MAVYLDYNATAPLRPEAEEAAICAMRIGGNPSSVHANGRMARLAVETAREQVARLVGVKVGSVTFTSGGTEANALAIESAAATGSRRLIALATEHDSIIQSAAVYGAELWPVEPNGLCRLDWLRDRLADWRAEDGAPFVALSLANNETGVIQPVAAVAEIVRSAGGWLHVDAVQAAGKMPVDFSSLGADTLSLSAHKLGGMTGSGALIAGTRATLHRRQQGGGQERGRRAGTENLPGIAAFGAAAQASAGGLAHQAAWRDAAQTRLVQGADVMAFSVAINRLPQTLCFAAEGFRSEMQVMTLDLAGFMVSAGAACSSGKVTASPVITQMGHADAAANTLRVSGGWATTEDDWTAFTDAWLAAWTKHDARRRVA